MSVEGKISSEYKYSNTHKGASAQNAQKEDCGCTEQLFSKAQPVPMNRPGGSAYLFNKIQECDQRYFKGALTPDFSYTFECPEYKNEIPVESHSATGQLEESVKTEEHAKVEENKEEPISNYNANCEIDRLLEDPAERKRLELAATKLNKSFGGWWINDKNKKVLNVLKDLNPCERAAVEALYDEKYSPNEPGKLRKDIYKHMTSMGDDHSHTGLGSLYSNLPGLATLGGLFAAKKLPGRYGAAALAASFVPGLAFGVKTWENKTYEGGKAIDLLNEGAKQDPRAAAVALNVAMKGIGTDEDTVKYIIKENSAEFLTETRAIYEHNFENSLEEDIDGDFSSSEADALQERMIFGNRLTKQAEKTAESEHKSESSH